MKKYVFVLLALLVLGWPVLRQLLWQVGWGYALMGMALPLCRLFEKRLGRSLSAGLALLAAGGAVLLMVTLLIPAVLRQGQQALAVLPEAWVQAQPFLRALPLGDLTPFTQALARLGATVWQWITGTAASLGRLMLSPVLAFYFLRDRRAIARGLCLLTPLGYRARVVRGAREALRELSGFLRGQALTALAVSLLTALGLLIFQVPGWLLLGVLMGVMELVPYLGPLAVTAAAVLFALPQGMGCTLAALGVMLAVQQLEGSLLSPRLMAGATRLHPALVLLIISAGGLMAGVGGMLLALPLAVVARGAIRGFGVL